jgi:hypothetical protein
VGLIPPNARVDGAIQPIIFNMSNRKKKKEKEKEKKGET